VKRLTLFILLLLNGCVGGTLSEKGSFEEYQLVPANPGEEKRLRACLEAIYADQAEWFAKKKSYNRRTVDLNVSYDCRGILVGLRSDKTRYTGIVRINHEESTVRWTINEKHEIFEHTDADLRDDMDLW
jgi:hypothetical protein